jgi:hypothetical protein
MTMTVIKAFQGGRCRICGGTIGSGNLVLRDPWRHASCVIAAYIRSQPSPVKTCEAAQVVGLDNLTTAQMLLRAVKRGYLAKAGKGLWTAPASHD